MIAKLLQAFEFIKLWFWMKSKGFILIRIDEEGDLYKEWVVEKLGEGYKTWLGCGPTRLVALKDAKNIGWFYEN